MRTTATTAALNQQSSPFVRWALLAYAVLIVYASWYPFQGWQQMGASPWVYLYEPLPTYWTWFDISVDVIGYLPFGVLLVLVCYPWLSRLWATIFAITTGIVVSALMEAVQTYLPSRISSNLDLLTNSLGVTLGACLGCWLTSSLLEKDLLGHIRDNWFVPQISHGLLIVLLWPLAQIYPQGFLFGLGQLLPLLSTGLNTYLGISIDLGEFLRQGAVFSVEQYWFAETLITCCGLVGAALLFLSLLRSQAPKVRLTFVLIVTALIIKSLALALFFKPESAFLWSTPSAQAGLIIGIMALYGLAFTPTRVQCRLAIVMLMVGLVAINVVPANPYFVDTLSTWVRGKFLTFGGAAYGLSVLWPWLALWFLLSR